MISDSGKEQRLLIACELLAMLDPELQKKALEEANIEATKAIDNRISFAINKNINMGVYETLTHK